MSPEQYIRIKRRYDYLMTYRLDKDLRPRVRVERIPNRKLELSVDFDYAPWLNTFKSHFVNKDLPKDLHPRAQQAIEHFAKKFAEDNGIPHTRIDCNWKLIAISYYYE